MNSDEPPSPVRPTSVEGPPAALRESSTADAMATSMNGQVTQPGPASTIVPGASEPTTGTQTLPQTVIPPIAIRENMISTAVKFLLNPQVQTSSLSHRRAFLKRKGLTDEEIRVAVQRSGAKEPSPSVATNPGHQSLPPSLPNNVPGGPLTLSPSLPPPPPPPRSMYAQARDYTALAVIISGVTYGIYKFFQKFILPFFSKQDENQKRLQNIEKSMTQVNNSLVASVKEIEKSLNTMQTLLEKQEQQLEQISRDAAVSKAMSSNRGDGDTVQLKQEITSLKGLLLNRHQFPSTPQQSGIPSWQQVASTEQVQPIESLQSKGDDDEENDVKKASELNDKATDVNRVVAFDSDGVDNVSSNGPNVPPLNGKSLENDRDEDDDNDAEEKGGRKGLNGLEGNTEIESSAS